MMPIELLSKFYTYNSKVPAINRRRIAPICLDSFAQSSINFPKLEGITSKTAQKLYNTYFVPQSKILEENTYSTFVLDKITGKPVEVLAKLTAKTKHFEEYSIYDKSASKLLGRKYFMFSFLENLIGAGYMETLSKDYLGIGLRLHQIGIERMLMKKMDNVEIVALPQSYPFHKSAGFEPLHKFQTIDKSYYKQILAGLMHDYKISESELDKMMVYKQSPFYDDKIIWDKDCSYENVLKYLYSQEDKSVLNNCHLGINMRLTDETLASWKKLISRSPVLYGKNFPSGSVL